MLYSAPEAALKSVLEFAARYNINLYRQIHLGAPIASGLFTFIYPGTLHQDGTKVAVKVPYGCPSITEIIQDVLREVHIWSKLRHKNVLEFLGITTEFQSTVSIVSRSAERGNAHDYVQDKTVDPRPLLFGISQGLHYLHSRKEGAVFHGDLKGSNILISAAGIPLLSNFGFSYLVNSSFDIPLSQGVRGSLNWLAPERFKNSLATAEGDVWAFGMITLELFTRKIPFHESTGYLAAMNRILNGLLPFAPALEDTCSRMTSEWWDLCCQCWERRPSLRPSMSAVVEEIFDILSGSALRYRVEIELYPPGHPHRATPSFELANWLKYQYLEQERIADLDEAIILHRAAVDLRPVGDAGRLSSLEHLDLCLWLRYNKQGAVPDLKECIDLRRSALQLCPIEDDSLSKLFYSLADGLKHRYSKQLIVGDLVEATAFHRAALDLRPAGHSNHFESLHALDSMVSLVQKKLKCYPCDGADRCALLSILIHHYCRNTDDQGIIDDIDSVIAARRKVLEHCPLEHPDHATSLHALALCLCLRFNKLTTVVDLEEAIMLTRSALRQCPTEHPDRVQYLQSLHIFRRHEEVLRQASQSPRISSEVHQLIMDALDDTLQNLPPRLLHTLSGVLCDRSAQRSRFRESPQYSELLASSEFYYKPQLVANIHRAISSYFRYVTLSHRWGDYEPSLRDIKGQVIHELDPVDGIAKLQKFCLATCERGYVWAWSDTCCIDKDSAVDLQYAIRSMFRWYRQSALTIVHLADVPDNTTGTLAKSAWFKRGWTLQELLAPRNVLFLTQNWLDYGEASVSNHKEDITTITEIERATGITQSHLTNFCPGTDDARLKLQWASTRLTTLPEDVAYSLFGIFNIHLPVLYGESMEDAIGRLLGEIISRSGDISVLDWVGEQSSFYSYFPASITSYETVPKPPASSNTSQLSVKELSNKALCKIRDKLTQCPHPQFINHRLILPCLIHRITAIQSRELRSSSGYKHHIQALGLEGLEITLSSELCNDSENNLLYILVRPWDVKLLGPAVDINTISDEKFFEVVMRPFCAILLMKKNHSEYQRIGSSATIGACLTDVKSILELEMDTLTIV